MTSPSASSIRLRHLLGIEGLSPETISALLDLSETYIEQNRQIDKKQSSLRGRTIINLFFENSTRTRTSFELAGKPRNRLSVTGRDARVRCVDRAQLDPTQLR